MSSKVFLKVTAFCISILIMATSVGAIGPIPQRPLHAQSTLFVMPFPIGATNAAMSGAAITVVPDAEKFRLNASFSFVNIGAEAEDLAIAVPVIFNAKQSDMALTLDGESVNSVIKTVSAPTYNYYTKTEGILDAPTATITISDYLDSLNQYAAP